MARVNVDHGFRLVRQDHGKRLRIQRRPPSKEDGALDHGLVALELLSPLFGEKQGASHCSSLGVSNDALKGALFLHDLEEELDRADGAQNATGHALLHELSHSLFRGITFREISNPRKGIGLLARLVIRLDESVVGRLSEEVLEALGRDRLARRIDEAKLGRVVRGQLLDEWRCRR